MKIFDTKSGANVAVYGLTGFIKSDESDFGIPGEKVVYLFDLGQGKSITNAAHDLVPEVDAAYPRYRICYRDSYGSWAELKKTGSEFWSYGLWGAWHPVEGKDYAESDLVDLLVGRK